MLGLTKHFKVVGVLPSGYLPKKQNPYIHRLETSPQSEMTSIELIYKDANTVCSGSSHSDEVVTSQTCASEGLQRAEGRTLEYNGMATS